MASGRKLQVKRCVVPMCSNTSLKNPTKKFVSVPRKSSVRRKWFRAMSMALDRHVYTSKKFLSTCYYCCEDHFKLKADLRNFRKRSFLRGKMFLRAGVVPHMFKCQTRDINFDKDNHPLNWDSESGDSDCTLDGLEDDLHIISAELMQGENARTVYSYEDELQIKTELMDDELHESFYKAHDEPSYLDSNNRLDCCSGQSEAIKAELVEEKPVIIDVYGKALLDIQEEHSYCLQNGRVDRTMGSRERLAEEVQELEQDVQREHSYCLHNDRTFRIMDSNVRLARLHTEETQNDLQLENMRTVDGLNEGPLRNEIGLKRDLLRGNLHCKSFYDMNQDHSYCMAIQGITDCFLRPSQLKTEISQDELKLENEMFVDCQEEGLSRLKAELMQDELLLAQERPASLHTERKKLQAELHLDNEETSNVECEGLSLLADELIRVEPNGERAVCNKTSLRTEIKTELLHEELQLDNEETSNVECEGLSLLADELMLVEPNIERAVCNETSLRTETKTELLHEELQLDNEEISNVEYEGLGLSLLADALMRVEPNGERAVCNERPLLIEAKAESLQEEGLDNEGPSNVQEEGPALWRIERDEAQEDYEGAVVCCNRTLQYEIKAELIQDESEQGGKESSYFEVEGLQGSSSTELIQREQQLEIHRAVSSDEESLCCKIEAELLQEELQLDEERSAYQVELPHTKADFMFDNKTWKDVKQDHSYCQDSVKLTDFYVQRSQIENEVTQDELQMNNERNLDFQDEEPSGIETELVQDDVSLVNIEDKICKEMGEEDDDDCWDTETVVDFNEESIAIRTDSIQEGHLLNRDIFVPIMRKMVTQRISPTSHKVSSKKTISKTKTNSPVTLKLGETATLKIKTNRLVTPKTGKTAATKTQTKNLVTLNAGKKYQCSTCPQKFYNICSLKKHLLTHVEKGLLRCDNCNKYFSRIDALITHAQKEHSSHACPLCVKFFPEKMHLEAHNRTHHKEASHKRRTCRKCFDDIDDLKAHIGNQHSVASFPCKKCKKCFADYESLKAHFCTYLRYVSKTQNKNLVTLKTGKKYQCSACPRKFYNISAVKNHYCLTHVKKKPIRCDNCSKSFSRIDRLITHTQKAHGSHACPLCVKFFSEKIHLEAHNRTHHKEASHTCGTCGKCFDDVDDLKAHIGTQHLEASLPCNTCKKRFADYESLKAHLGTHLRDVSYERDDLNKRFVDNDGLNANIGAQSRVASLPCNTCRKRFADYEGLKAHLDTHLRDVSYERDDLNKRFVDNDDLNAHIGAQHRVASLPCNTCKKRFADYEGLKAHVGTHLRDVSYERDDLNKRFVDNDGLNAHNEAQHRVASLPCNTCKKRFADYEGLKAHLGTHLRDVFYERDDPKKRFVDNDGLSAHIGNQRIASFICNTCKKCFADNGDLKAHICTHTQDELNNIRERFVCNDSLKAPSGTNPRLVYACDTCKRCFADDVFLKTHTCSHPRETSADGTLKKCFDGNSEDLRSDNREQRLKQHFDIVNLNMYIARDCAVCLKGFANSKTLTKHMRQAHGIYVCKCCPKYFSKQADLSAHAKTHISFFNCKLCNKCFISENFLRIHNRENTCNTCDKCFCGLYDLKEHLLTHIADKPYKCEICSRSFTCRSDLTRHEAIHSVEKPYTCEKCLRSFTDVDTLKNHLRNNCIETYYKCHICNKFFGSAINFQMHSRTHNVNLITGIRATLFCCHYCPKSFSDSSSLRQHVRAHTGEKAYSCEICKKGFPSESSLSCHVRTHTGDKLFRCDICRRRFSEITNYRVHLSTHTEVSPRTNY